MTKHTLENNQTIAINVTLLPLLLCKHFEGPSDNTQWRKVKLMQPIWLCFFWCRQSEETFESTQWSKVKQMY